MQQTAHSMQNFATRNYAGWPKKVNHYEELSLNRIKNRQHVRAATFRVYFEYKMSTRML